MHIPWGAKAQFILWLLMYGLKPVPFNRTRVELKGFVARN